MSVLVSSRHCRSKREREFGERNRLAGQALVRRALIAAELCDVALDDAHGAALALADTATAGKRQARGLSGIEKGSEFRRPDKAFVGTGDVNRLWLQRP